MGSQFLSSIISFILLIGLFPSLNAFGVSSCPMMNEDPEPALQSAKEGAPNAPKQVNSILSTAYQSTVSYLNSPEYQQKIKDMAFRRGIDPNGRAFNDWFNGGTCSNDAQITEFAKDVWQMIANDGLSFYLSRAAQVLPEKYQNIFGRKAAQLDYAGVDGVVGPYSSSPKWTTNLSYGAGSFEVFSPHIEVDFGVSYRRPSKASCGYEEWYGGFRIQLGGSDTRKVEAKVYGGCSIGKDFFATACISSEQKCSVSVGKKF